MNDIWAGVLTIATATIGLATLSVILSNRANTANVIGAASGGFANILGAATSPVTGASLSVNTGNSLGGSSLGNYSSLLG